MPSRVLPTNGNLDELSLDRHTICDFAKLSGRVPRCALDRQRFAFTGSEIQLGQAWRLLALPYSDQHL